MTKMVLKIVLINDLPMLLWLLAILLIALLEGFIIFLLKKSKDRQKATLENKFSQYIWVLEKELERWKTIAANRLTELDILKKRKDKTS